MAKQANSLYICNKDSLLTSGQSDGHSDFDWVSWADISIWVLERQSFQIRMKLRCL